MNAPRKSMSISFAIALLLGSSTGAFAQKAKITMKEARATAIRTLPDARIKSAELEHEDGKFIYSFDMKTSTGITEVWVDAMTGAVVKQEKETKADERKEAKTERMEKKGKK